VTRGIRLLKTGHERRVPIIGRVAAGQPILAAENVDDYVTVPDELFPKRPDYFLRVRGDSMIDAGILDGDLVAIERCAQAELGQIIVARIGEEATLKRLAGTRHEPVLKAENPRYTPIPLSGIAWSVEGRYLGLVRR
jgi:repressor LexA